MKVAAITGAGRGIGRGCALVFARAGFAVALAEIEPSWGEKVAQELQAQGAQAFWWPADFRQEASIEEFFDQIDNRWGRLDVLVNNAGTNRPGNILETSLEDFESLLRLNLSSAFLCSRAAIPRLRRSGGGSIVHVSSLAGILGQKEGVAYSTSKAALIGLTRALALDHTREGIRVNCIAPGNVDTPLMEEWIARQKEPEEVRKRIYEAQLVGRLATPEEIGEAVLFLATHPFLTGVILEVEGGARLGY
jgi:NAD(P)-dependent dehydrogenase (short-subunit alcohol dehydrogenase family)